MEWLLLFFYIEFGSFGTGQWELQESTPIIQEAPQYYAEVSARAEMFDLLFIEGTSKARTYSIYSDERMTVFPDEYMVSAGLRFENIEMGMRQWIAPRQFDAGGGHGEVYIRFSADMER